MPDFDYVLFDLGGVLIEVGGVRAMGDLAGIADDREVWRRWLTCPWVREFERGRCSVKEFADGFVADWELAIGAEEFAEAFRLWTRGPFDGAHELLESTHQYVRTACLSNSNAIQWPEYVRSGITDHLDLLFLSHELDLIKPDREIFDHVLGATGSPADRLLFLDDNELNVVAARAAGITAVEVRGVDEARTALLRFGILPGP
jgi:putative hydrolase of the HAD superfamily